MGGFWVDCEDPVVPGPARGYGVQWEQDENGDEMMYVGFPRPGPRSM